MKSFKTSLYICNINYKKWFTNYKIWIAAMLLVIFTQTYTKDFYSFAKQLDVKIAPWLLPFITNQKYLKILFYLPLLLIFCDAPFIDNNQPYVIVRSKRFYWNLGQLFYIFSAVVIYFIFLLLLTVILNAPVIEYNMGWGKALSTISHTSAANSMKLNIGVSSSVLRYFSPLQAMWFTMLLLCLCGVFLGMLIYVINSMTGNKTIGIFVASFFLILDSVVISDSRLWWFSPVTWSAVDKIAVGGNSPFPSFTYVLVMYIVLIGTLSILSFIVSKKQSVVVNQPI